MSYPTIEIDHKKVILLSGLEKKQGRTNSLLSSRPRTSLNGPPEERPVISVAFGHWQASGWLARSVWVLNFLVITTPA